MWSLIVLILLALIIPGSEGEGFRESSGTIGQDCPPRICNNSIPSSMIQQVRRQCCFHCSCDPDCGRHHNCCYDDLDTYDVTKDMVCVDTGPFQFLVVDTCPDKALSVDTSVVPVSSDDERRVYINAGVAECNNVTGYFPWNLRIACPDMASILHQATGLSNDCSENYFYPPDSFWWLKYFICPASLISECDTSSGYVPMSSELEGCVNIRDPYMVGDRVFQNGHCASCRNDMNVVFVYVAGLCGHRDFNVVLGNPGSLYVTATKTGVALYRSMVRDNSTTCEEPSVPAPASSGCRRIFCPEGMVREDGSCRYFFESIHNAYVSLKIRLYQKLPATKPLTVLDLDQLTNYEKMSPRNFIATTCPLMIPYDAFTATLVSPDDEVLLDHILVQGKMRLTEDEFKNLINETLNCVSEVWKLTISDQEFEFLSAIDTDTDPVAHGATRNKTKMSCIQSNGPCTSMETVHYDALSGPAYMRQAGMIVSQTSGTSQLINYHMTALHLCKQVLVYPDEVEIHSNYAVLKHNGEILGNGEYQVLYTKHGGRNVAFATKICLKSYSKVNVANGQSAALPLKINVLMTVILVAHRVGASI